MSWNGARGQNPFTWDQFDRLPAPLRYAMNFAPTGLGTARAWWRLRAGWTLAEVIAGEREIAFQARRQRVLETYGPDHPEARL